MDDKMFIGTIISGELQRPTEADPETLNEEFALLSSPLRKSKRELTGASSLLA